MTDGTHLLAGFVILLVAFLLIQVFVADLAAALIDMLSVIGTELIP